MSRDLNLALEPALAPSAEVKDFYSSSPLSYEASGLMMPANRGEGSPKIPDFEEVFMKNTLRMITAVAITVLGTLPLHAQAAPLTHSRSCNLLTIKGTYAFTIHGQILTGPGAGTVDGIALTTFDGAGNMSQFDVVSHNGTVAEIWRPGSGPYTVNADCTGTLQINAAGSPPLNLQFVVARQGSEIHTVVTNDGFAITSDAVRQ